MTITINGTTGIAGVDGSAGTPAVQGADTNTGIFFPAADTIAFAEGGAEVARFDSSGNLLVNTTTAQTGAKLAVTGGIQGTITSGTSVASTSGTSINFTGIPSWVKRITIMLNGVSWSSTAPLLRVQIGSGSVETSGYLSAITQINSAGTASWQSAPTAGFDQVALSNAADTVQGAFTLTLLGSNAWTCTSLLYRSSGTTQSVGQQAGSKTTSGALDRVRITTSNGTDTFDAGTINILYEG